MTDPERLLTTSEDAFERALLQSAVEDPDERERSARLLAALGLDLPPPGGADGGPDADPGPGSPASPTQATGSSSAATAATTKIGAIVAAAALAVGAGVLAWPTTSVTPLRHASPPPSSLFEVRAPAAESATPSVTSSDPAPAPPSPTLTAAPRRSALPASSSAPAIKPSPSTLSEEVRALDQARNALKRGDRAAARAALAAYFARFPQGILAPEARKLAGQVDKK
ncbi:MAG: hypothetical protein R3B13_00295 [Polyangiaceae bacterium]